MFTRKFGVEVEFTGITRKQAAETAAVYLNTTAAYAGGYYETYEVRAPDGKVWKFMYDGSIHCQRKENRRLISTDSQYSVEMVTPILRYREDIDTLQGLVRRLRKAGALPTVPAASTSTWMGRSILSGASATLSTSSPAIMIYSIRHCRLHRRGCATARRWICGWWSR